MTTWGLSTYSKTFHPDDLGMLEPEWGCVRALRHDLRELPVDFAHHCRYWEYSLALRMALRTGAKTVLDVGGGGGLFSPATAKCGLEVTQIDLGDHSGIVASQAAVIQRPIYFALSDLMNWESGPYDLVAALSVIEHTRDDVEFFEKLLSLATPKTGCVALTTDFHPSGGRLVDGHLRTYNAEALKRFQLIAADHGFLPWCGPSDWSYFGEHVYQYNFASLLLRRML